MLIRQARPEDAATLSAIYAPYVKETAITFETAVPTAADFCARMAAVQARYPYLVAEEGGRVLGYAYASTFIARAAADWTVETSIYVDKKACHKGAGRALHEALEAALGEMGIVNLCAAIAAPCDDNPYLDNNSLQFHTHMGYTEVARFDRVGYKFGHWLDLVWMQKRIGTIPCALPWQ